MAASRGTQDQGLRILASLEHGGKPAMPPRRTAVRQLDRWIVGVCALAVLAALAWSMRAGPAAPPEPRLTTMAEQPTPAAAQASLASAEAGIAPSANNQAAAIVNEPGTPEQHAHVAAPAASVAPAAPAPATAAVTAAVARKAGPLAHSTPAAHVATPATAAPRAGGTANTTARTSVTAASSGATADTDVALLTALVAHAGQPAAVTPERSRDVVERRDGDGTATLLARCKQLGLIEGMLCRSRICSGRWESDAACRAPSH